MHKNVIIGNAIDLIASIVMSISGTIKDSKKFLIVQNIELILSTLSNVILGGYTGAVVNIIAIFTNTLCYKEKLNKTLKTIIMVLQIVFCLIVNKLGVLGLFPLFATLIGVAFLTTDDKKLKILTIVLFSIWTVYDLLIMAYIAFIFDIIGIISNSYSLYKIIIHQKNKKGK